MFPMTEFWEFELITKIILQASLYLFPKLHFSLSSTLKTACFVQKTQHLRILTVSQITSEGFGVARGAPCAPYPRSGSAWAHPGLGGPLRAALLRWGEGGKGTGGDSPPAPHVWEHCDQADHAESRQSTAHPTTHRLLVCTGFSRRSCEKRRRHRRQPPRDPPTPATSHHGRAPHRGNENRQWPQWDTGIATYRELSQGCNGWKESVGVWILLWKDKEKLLMGRNLPSHPALLEPLGWRRTAAVLHTLESIPPTDTPGTLLFPKSPHCCAPSTERDFSTTDGQRLGADGKAPAFWKPNEPAVVSPPRVVPSSPAGRASCWRWPRRCAGSWGGDGALRARRWRWRPAGTRSSLRTQSKGHGSRPSSRSSRPSTQGAGYLLPLAPRFPASGQPKPKNNPQKRRLLLNPSKSRRRNLWLCTQVSP